MPTPVSSSGKILRFVVVCMVVSSVAAAAFLLLRTAASVRDLATGVGIMTALIGTCVSVWFLPRARDRKLFAAFFASGLPLAFWVWALCRLGRMGQAAIITVLVVVVASLALVELFARMESVRARVMSQPGLVFVSVGFNVLVVLSFLALRCPARGVIIALAPTAVLVAIYCGLRRGRIYARGAGMIYATEQPRQFWRVVVVMYLIYWVLTVATVVFGLREMGAMDALFDFMTGMQ